MAGEPRLARRFLGGLAIALLVSVGGGALLWRASAAQARDEVARRAAVIRAQALAELLTRSGLRGDPARAALARWQAGRPAGTEARVVLGATLEGSTAAADAGEKLAPRRLAQSEKPLFDQAKRLAAAIEGNAAGESTKPEVEVAEEQGGGRTLAAPLLEDGQPVGMVLLSEPSLPAGGSTPSPLAPLAALVLPLLAFWLAARAIGPRLVPLLAAALVALGAGLAGLWWTAAPGLAGIQAEAAAALSRTAAGEAKVVSEALAAAGVAVEPALQPGRWDAGPDRKPLGLLAPEGAVLQPAVAARAEAEAAGLRRSLLSAGLTGLLLLLLGGLGVFSRTWQALKVNRTAYAYIAPAMLGTLVLVFFPFGYGVILSFTDQNIYNTNAPLSELLVGFRNYATILGDFSIARRGADGALVWNYLNFYWTFLFTVAWTVTNVLGGVTMGLILALILNVKELRFRPYYRVILILPWAMPNYITALIWKGMFHQQFGVVNQVIQLFGGQPVAWFDRPLTSFLTALATNGWLSFPFMMVVSLGALQSIPADIYEAARVDGATKWQQFKAITLPSLRPALVPAVILSVVWTFNMFNIIYLVTGGAPEGATEILITQAYKFAFEKYRYGYAAAYSVVIFGILLVYGWYQNRATRATEGI